jgi:CheY-like chemotaxis protein
MRVRFWGTRGSIATPGAGTIRFGGNTSCVELTVDSGQRLILDCGTGLRSLGNELLAQTSGSVRATFLVGHTHWDHIQGFPFFMPAFVPGNEFDVYGPQGSHRSFADVLSGQMQYNYFPVEIDQLPARLTCHDLAEGVHRIDGLQVSTRFLNHPAMTLGYRIMGDGVSVAYLCDHEPFSDTLWRPGAEPGRIDSILHEGDRGHAEFMVDADLVIHDAQYTPEEYVSKKNWGHSTYRYAVEVAAAAGARRLALTHHDPSHDDEALHEIERRARAVAADLGAELDVFCAREGSEIVLSPRAALPQAAQPEASARSTPGTYHILLVDDDPDIRRMARRALDQDDYVITEATWGGEALVRVNESIPDLIVLDLMMPELGGLEVLKMLRAKPATARVPVLVLTGHGDEQTVLSSFVAGATDFVSKPFSIPQFATRVRTCLLRAEGKASAS